MSSASEDAKLKRFIELSLQGNQVRNATSVLYMLVSNTIDEIGYKLGIVRRRKEAGESVSEYMTLINKLFRTNFEVNIFPDNAITTIKVVELLFERKYAQKKFPITRLKELTQLYYDIKHLKIPNLHDTLKETDIMENRTISLMSFFSRGASPQASSPVKALLLHRIQQDQNQLKARLERAWNQEDLVKLIQLKSLETSLLSHLKRKKIRLSGTLTDGIDYSLLTSNSSRFGLIGIIITFIMISIICIAQMLMVGLVTAEMGELLLLCIGVILVFSYLTKKVIMPKR